MFWARAWQAMCSVTPPSSGSRPGASPSLRAMSTMYSADVEGRLGQFLDRRVVRHDQRPLELEHQRAGRHQRDDVVALVDTGTERRRDLVRRLGDLGEIAGLQLRHAAAAGIDDLGLDAVAGEHRARRLADARIVVVDETGGVEHRLAPGGRRVAVDRAAGCGGRALTKVRPLYFGRAALRSTSVTFSSSGRVSLLSRLLPQLASGATKARQRCRCGRSCPVRCATSGRVPPCARPRGSAA